MATAAHVAAVAFYAGRRFCENRLTAYAEQYPDQCKLTEDDAVIGCKSFEIARGRFSFRLTAPYSEERRRAASDNARKNGFK
jgi:hypothetical protein